MLLAIPPAQRAAFYRTITGPHLRGTRVAILDRQGRTIETITRSFQSGSVNVDARRDVTRALSLTILDPRHAYGFDADTYQGGSLDLRRMVRAWTVIDGPFLAKPVSIPVHTGPVTALQRDGALVAIEAQGKEVYGLVPSHRTLTIKKGARRTDAIKTILRERMGETRLGGIPDLPARLPEDLVIGPKDQAWKRALRLASSLDHRQLFYGGDGVPYLRRRPGKPVWTFRGGVNGGSLTSPLVTTADLREVKNHWRITGATPKGKKKPVSGSATAPRGHHLSPWDLGGFDSPMWLEGEDSNDHLRTDAECDKVAAERLKDTLRLVHATSFNATPVPFLEPLDLARAITDHESVTTRLETFEIPLGRGGDMTVGYVDPYRKQRRRRGGLNVPTYFDTTRRGA